MSVYIMRGPSGSGKSTQARTLLNDPDRQGSAIIVSRDIIRQSFGMEGKGVLSAKDEALVTKVEMDMLRQGVREGIDVIVDNTNLNNSRAAQYATQAHLLGAEFFEVNLFVPGCTEVYVGRSDIRADVVRRQCKQAMRMKPIEARVELVEPIVTGATHKAIIVDVDGTLAHAVGRDPYDDSRAGDDLVDEVMRTIVSDVYFQYHVIVVSGRRSSTRDITEQWLDAHTVAYDSLFMREEGDNRHDAQVKLDIYRDKIAPCYNVVGVFDDRRRVLDMWQTLGLKTFDVGQGTSDF